MGADPKDSLPTRRRSMLPALIGTFKRAETHSGSRGDQKKNLRDFWRKNDESPALSHVAKLKKLQ